MTYDIISSDFNAKIEEFRDWKRTITNELHSTRQVINDTYNFIAGCHLTEAEAYKAKATLAAEKHYSEQLKVLQEELKEFLLSVIF